MKVDLIHFIVFYGIIKTCLSCDGYNVRVKRISSCGGENNIIKVSENSTAFMNGNCEVFSNVCADVKPYKTAIATLVVKDGGMMVLNTTFDMCMKSKSNKELRSIARAMSGVKCDGGKQELFCDNSKKVATLSVFARKSLGLVSNNEVFVHSIIKHDSGMSCVEGESIVKRKKH